MLCDSQMDTVVDNEVVKTGRKNTVVSAPQLVFMQSAEPSCLQQKDIIQLSVHKIDSISFKREAKLIFPSVDVSNLIAIPTMQRAKIDLVSFGDHVEKEKDRCLELFFHFAERFCNNLIAQGHWADFIDPSSGLPMKTHSGNKVFNEVECASVLLSYKVVNAGCCKIILHPAWGSALFPATMFTTAPSEVVLQLIASMEVVPNVLSCSGGSVDGSRNSSSSSRTMDDNDVFVKTYAVETTVSGNVFSCANTLQCSEQCSSVV